MRRSLVREPLAAGAPSAVRHSFRHGDPFRLSCWDLRVTTSAFHHMISQILPDSRSLVVATELLLVMGASGSMR